LFVIPPETPQTVVIGLDQAGEAEEGEMFAAGGLQFAGRTNPVVVAVKPDFQEQARMAGRAACHGGGPGEPQHGQIQLVHKLPQETGRVIGAYPIFQRGGKEKLLSVIRSDWLCHASQTPTAAIHSKKCRSFETVSAARPYQIQPINPRTFVWMSPPRIKDSPTKIASAPHRFNRSTSARE